MADEKKVPADKATDAAKGTHPVPAAKGIPPRETVSDAPRDDTPRAAVDDPKLFSRPGATRREAAGVTREEAEAMEREREDPARKVATANFSIAEFQDIYASLRDGDWYSAFRKSIRFLDSIFNEARTVAPRGLRPIGAAGPHRSELNAADMRELDRTLELMDKQLTQSRGMSGELDEKKVPLANMQRKSESASAPQMNIMDILAIARVVLDFVRQWRESR